MRHCQKISGGRVPPVTSREEWENLIREFTFLTADISSWIYVWLSATEGDTKKRLTTRDHWPETKVVNNKTQKLKAEEPPLNGKSPKKFLKKRVKKGKN